MQWISFQVILSATSTLTSTKLPTELLFSGISTLSTGVFFMSSTVLLVDSNSLLLVWDLRRRSLMYATPYEINLAYKLESFNSF